MNVVEKDQSSDSDSNGTLYSVTHFHDPIYNKHFDALLIYPTNALHLKHSIVYA
jgi:hypothetical protein